MIRTKIVIRSCYSWSIEKGGVLYSFYGNEDGFPSFREGNWIAGEIKIGLAEKEEKGEKTLLVSR